MPSIMKKSCVSTFSGADPQISAFRFAPIIFLWIVGNTTVCATLSHTPSHRRALLSCLRTHAAFARPKIPRTMPRSEEHTSELQSPMYLVVRLLLEKKKQSTQTQT